MSDAESSPGIKPLYADGRFLVVNLRNPRFPDLCIKTGKPAEGSRYLFRLHVSTREKTKFASDAAGYALANLTPILGAVGPIAQLVLADEIALSVGLNKVLCKKLEGRARWGLISAIVGLLGLLTTPLLTFAISESMLRDGPAERAGFGVLHTFVLLGCGLPLLTLFCWGLFALINVAMFLTERRTRDGFLWLAGASMDFLKHLPTWREIEHGPLKDW